MNKKGLLGAVEFGAILGVILVSILVMAGGVLAEISTIIVDNPNDGAYSGSISVEWTANGGCSEGDKVKIYWGKGGILGLPAIQGYVGEEDCAVGSYSWDISARDDGTDYQLKIRSSIDPDIYDFSNNFFTIDNTPPTAGISNVETSWVTSDTMDISCSDTGGSECIETKWYYFDADGTCSDNRDDYTSTLDNSITVDTTNTDYLCLWVEDNADNSDTAVSSRLMVDTEDPVTTDNAPSIWMASDMIVDLTADDATSGVDYTEYCVDQANSCVPSTIGTSVTVTNEGINYVRYYSIDNTGNDEDVNSATVKIDKTDPIVGEITVIPSYSAGSTYVSGTSTISAEITDISGPESCEYTIDADELTPTWLSADVVGGDSCIANDVNTAFASSINIRATDYVGKTGTGTAVPVIPDTIPPVTTDDSSSYPGWQNSNVDIELICDDGAGSGCDITYYCIDQDNLCDPAIEYTVPVTVSDEGTNYVRYKSIDNVGNEENVQSSNLIKIDYTGPTVGVSGAPTNWLVNQSGVEVAVTCEDLGSGCDEATYKLKIYSGSGDCSINYDDYSDPGAINPITEYTVVCAAAKDLMNNPGFSDPVEVKVHDTIQEAINNATTSETIDVAAGTYNENLVINKSLTVQGENRDTTIIDGGGMLGPGVDIQADDVTFQGFTIKDFTASPIAGIGAILVEGDNAVINDNIIKDITSTEAEPAGIGIDVHADNVQVTNNIVHDVGSIGIRVRYDWVNPPIESNNVLLDNNEVYRTANTGLLITGYAKGVTITNNEIYESLEPTPYNLFVHYGASDVVIDNNNIHDPYDSIYGHNLVLAGCDNVVISDNTISGATSGKNLYILSDYAPWYDINALSTNIEITDNEILNGKWGIRIANAGAIDASQMASTTTINNNIIEGNTEYGVENMIATNVDATYNYWGEPNGPSGEGSGDGDAVSENVLYEPWAYDEDMNVDITKPTSAIDSPDASSWQKEGFAVDVSDSDTVGLPPDTAASGLDVCRYRVYSDLNGDGDFKDLGELTKDWDVDTRTCDNQFTLTVGVGEYCQAEGEDTCKVQVKALDIAGNDNWYTSPNQVRKFSIDWTPPTTTDSGTDTNWHSSDVTVTLNCDDGIGIGCDQTYYCIDQLGTCTPSTLGTSVVVSNEGINYVRFYSVDLLGNIEAVKDAANTVKIDKSAPQIIDVTGNTSTQVGQAKKISATITDAGSGVESATVYYMDVNGIPDEVDMVKGAEDTWSADIPEQSEKGTVEYYIIAVDDVGNDVTSDTYYVTVYDFVLILKYGWNQISIPKEPNTESFNRLEVSVDVIYEYDATVPPSEAWIRDPGSIKPGIGYFIYSTSDQDVGINYKPSAADPNAPSPVIDLVSGWNLIGHMCTEESDIEYVFNTQIAQDRISQMLWYDTADSKYEYFVPPDYRVDFNTTEPGKGYWILLVMPTGEGSIPYTNTCFVD